MLLASESALISSDATVSGVDAAEGVVTGFIDSDVSEGASDIWKLSEPTEEPESSEVSSRTVLAADASALEDAVLDAGTMSGASAKAPGQHAHINISANIPLASCKNFFFIHDASSFIINKWVVS